MRGFDNVPRTADELGTSACHPHGHASSAFVMLIRSILGHRLRRLCNFVRFSRVCRCLPPARLCRDIEKGTICSAASSARQFTSTPTFAAVGEHRDGARQPTFNYGRYELLAQFPLTNATTGSNQVPSSWTCRQSREPNRSRPSTSARAEQHHASAFSRHDRRGAVHGVPGRGVEVVCLGFNMARMHILSMSSGKGPTSDVPSDVAHAFNEVLIFCFSPSGDESSTVWAFADSALR